MRRGEATAGTCSHCNQCMPTIYTGTRCVELAPAAASQEVRAS